MISSPFQAGSLARPVVGSIHADLCLIHLNPAPGSAGQRYQASADGVRPNPQVPRRIGPKRYRTQGTVDAVH